MNKQLTFIVAASLLATACASSRIDYQRDMQHYVGHSKAELTHGLGKAEQQYEQDGLSIVVFRPISYYVPVSTPRSSTDGSMGRANSMSYNQNQKMYANCMVAFTLKNDIVQSWLAKGRECPKSMLQP